ncbi:hypothetical protein ACQ4PT_012683 [Festuca glaucescens]
MEPRGASHRRSGTLLILLAVFLATAAAASASAIGDKCAVCKAVAAELEIGMSSEKPRNHLDLRNRLNSKGQREGKVIDYRVSELRIVELLDDLCDKMQDYTLKKSSNKLHCVQLDSDEKEWVKVTNWSSFQTDKKAAARAHSKNLSSYCGRLLEETEDEGVAMSVRLSGVDDNLESVKAAAPFIYDTILVGIEAMLFLGGLAFIYFD